MGGATAPPILFVLTLGIFGNGGDWPAATFLIRASLFLLASLFLYRSDTIHLRMNVVDILLLILWALDAVSLARDGYRWVSYQWFLHHSAALALYLTLRRIPPEEDRLPRAIGMLILAAGAVQIVFAIGFQRIYLGFGRPFGTLENPNFLAEFFVYSCLIAYFAMERAEGKPVVARAGPVLIVLSLIGIWMTGSRGGGLLVLGVGSLLLAFHLGWRRSLIAASAVVLAVALVPNPLRERFLGVGDPFAFERIRMWKASLRIFLENPFGVGVGQFKYYWHIFRDPVEGTIVRYAKYARTPHSEFFSILSELGAPGAAAFLGLGAAGFLSLRRAVAREDSIALCAAVILFASFFHSFFEYNYHIFGLLLLNASALAVVSGRLFRPLVEREVRLGNAVKGVSLLLLGLFVVYSGMTYAATVLEGPGMIAFQEGRYENAELWFARAAVWDPWRATYPDSASAAAYRLYENGKGEDHMFRAIHWEQEAYSRNRMDYRYPARLGFLLSKAIDHVPGPSRGLLLGASFGMYDKAIALNPHAADIRYLKALLLKMAGMPDEARILVETELIDEPRHVKGWVLLGELKEEADPTGALRAYEQALSIHLRYRDQPGEPYEKEWVGLDQKMVEEKIRSLGSGQGR
ncbi:MAG: O-antigen ligase family protein [Candidatus Deferrimicrobiaceae bacterium]